MMIRIDKPKSKTTKIQHSNHIVIIVIADI